MVKTIELTINQQVYLIQLENFRRVDTYEIGHKIVNKKRVTSKEAKTYVQAKGKRYSKLYKDIAKANAVKTALDKAINEFMKSKESVLKFDMDKA